MPLPMPVAAFHSSPCRHINAPIQLSSITLTTLTLTILSTRHTHIRTHQSNHLQQSATLLNTLASGGPSTTTTPYPLPAEVQEERYEQRLRYPGQSGGAAELIKERWNREVEGFVKNVVGKGPEFGSRMLGMVEELGRRAWTATRERTEEGEGGKAR
ncbi:MAG: hypothetical protein M1831_004132 [Alyxoria varia]|nr:MAG: hypothetical protein M1831_004132 [Alyxoria varia]